MISFSIEIILGACGHLIANFHDPNQETTTSSPYLDSTNMSNAHHISQLNLNLERRVVIPTVAFFRDSIKKLIMLVQVLVIVALVFLPLIIGYKRSINDFSLQSQGFW